MNKEMGLCYTYYHISDKYAFLERWSGTSESQICVDSIKLPVISFVVADLVENFDEASKDEAN